MAKKLFQTLEEYLKMSEGKPLSQTQVKSAVKGRGETIKKLLETFEQEGKVAVEKGGNGKANLYSII